MHRRRNLFYCIYIFPAIRIYRIPVGFRHLLPVCPDQVYTFTLSYIQYVQEANRQFFLRTRMEKIKPGKLLILLCIGSRYFGAHVNYVF